MPSGHSSSAYARHPLPGPSIPDPRGTGPETSSPVDHEILVRVHAGVVTPADGAARKDEPLLICLTGGIRRPKQPILGSEIADDVAAVGADVIRFQVGDRDMAATGHASVDTGHKTGNVVLRLACEGSGK